MTNIMKHEDDNWTLTAPGEKELSQLVLFTEIIDELNRSVELHGEQDLPMGSSIGFKPVADTARKTCDKVTENGTVTWRHIIVEEMWEAMAEPEWDKCREELVQTAAMIFKAIANGDKHNEHG